VSKPNSKLFEGTYGAKGGQITISEAAPHVFASPDPLVGELATSIEKAIPGQVVSINRTVYNAKGKIATDFDIELTNAVLQVKSGAGKGLTSQLERTAAVTNKEVIGYGPNIRQSIIVGAKAKALLYSRIWLIF